MFDISNKSQFSKNIFIFFISILLGRVTLVLIQTFSKLCETWEKLKNKSSQMPVNTSVSHVLRMGREELTELKNIRTVSKGIY